MFDGAGKKSIKKSGETNKLSVQESKTQKNLEDTKSNKNSSKSLVQESKTQKSMKILNNNSNIFNELSDEEKIFWINNRMCIDFEYPLYEPSNYLRDIIQMKRICENETLIKNIDDTIKILFGKIIKMINTYNANNNKKLNYRMCFGEKFSTLKQDTLTLMVYITNFIMSNTSRIITTYIFKNIDTLNTNGEYNKNQIQYMIQIIEIFYTTLFENIELPDTIYTFYFTSCLMFRNITLTKRNIGFDCTGKLNDNTHLFASLYSFDDHLWFGREMDRITDTPGIYNRIQHKNNTYLGSGYSGTTLAFITLASIFVYDDLYDFYATLSFAMLYYLAPKNHTINEILNIILPYNIYSGRIYTGNIKTVDELFGSLLKKAVKSKEQNISPIDYVAEYTTHEPKHKHTKEEVSQTIKSNVEQGPILSKLLETADEFLQNKVFESEHIQKRFKDLKQTLLKTFAPYDEDALKTTDILYVNIGNLLSGKDTLVPKIRDALNNDITLDSYKKISSEKTMELLEAELVIMSYVHNIIMHKKLEECFEFAVYDKCSDYLYLFVPLTPNELKFKQFIDERWRNHNYEDITFKDYKKAFKGCFGITDDMINSRISQKYKNIHNRKTNTNIVNIQYNIALKKILIEQNLVLPIVIDQLLFSSIDDFIVFSSWIKYLMSEQQQNKKEILLLKDLLKMQLPSQIPQQIIDITPIHMIDIINAYKEYDEAINNQEKLLIIFKIVTKYRVLLNGDYTQTLKYISKNNRRLFYKVFLPEYKNYSLKLELQKYVAYTSVLHNTFKTCIILEDSGNPFFQKGTPFKGYKKNKPDEGYALEGYIIINMKNTYKLILVYANKIGLNDYVPVFFTPFEFDFSFVSGCLSNEINYTLIRKNTGIIIRQIGEQPLTTDGSTIPIGTIYAYKSPNNMKIDNDPENMVWLSKLSYDEIVKKYEEQNLTLPQMETMHYSITQKERNITNGINKLLAKLEETQLKSNTHFRQQKNDRDDVINKLMEEQRELPEEECENNKSKYCKLKEFHTDAQDFIDGQNKLAIFDEKPLIEPKTYTFPTRRGSLTQEPITSIRRVPSIDTTPKYVIPSKREDDNVSQKGINTQPAEPTIKPTPRYVPPSKRENNKLQSTEPALKTTNKQAPLSTYAQKATLSQETWRTQNRMPKPPINQDARDRQGWRTVVGTR